MINADDNNLNYRRDILFLGLSGIFLTALVLGNIIGTTKFVTLFSVDLPIWLNDLIPEIVLSGSTYSMSIPVGVLAYPFTFLATDLISELFGRKKAQLVVWVGLAMNFFMLFLMMVAHYLPNSAGVSGGLNLFEGVYEFMILNVIASMVAYLLAQSVDVQLFHFWKKEGSVGSLGGSGNEYFHVVLDDGGALSPEQCRCKWWLEFVRGGV